MISESVIYKQAPSRNLQTWEGNSDVALLCLVSSKMCIEWKFATLCGVDVISASMQLVKHNSVQDENIHEI